MVRFSIVSEKNDIWPQKWYETLWTALSWPTFCLISWSWVRHGLACNLYSVFNVPSVYTHRECADMLYIYGFCDWDSNNAVIEYRRLFPTRRTPSSRVFVRSFQSVINNGIVPSAGINYERVVAVRDNILHAVQRSTRRIARQLRVGNVRVGNATRAVHTRAAVCITAEGRVFENVL